MATWTITSDGAYEYKPGSGEDAEVGWAWDLERSDGETFRAKVELASTAATVRASGGQLESDAEEAIRTKGKSALKLWLDQDEIPERIVIHTHGVTRPSG